MAAKLIIRDPATNKVMYDSTMRLFRVLANLSTGTTDGSVAVADLNQGYVAVMTGDTEKYHPTFSVSGGNVNWSFDPSIPVSQRQNADALVGVF